MEQSDEKILELLKNEETQAQAFSTLVKKYQKQMYYYIRKMVLDHDDADDVTQNTFIKIWKGIPKFRGDAKLSTWMYKIATNEAITFINKKKKIAGVPLDQVEYSLSKSLEADVYYDGDEIQRQLQTAMAMLPQKQKAVFVMKYYEAKKYSEISEITGTSVGALKASFHHAVTKIENFLKQD